MNMELDQQHQASVSGATPLPTTRTNDANTVSTASAEAVVWYYNNSGAWGAAVGEVAGTIVTAKLAYSKLLNAMGGAPGSYSDTSLSWGAATRVSDLVRVPEEAFSKMVDMTVAEKESYISTWLVTNGQYAIDHRRGEVWAKPKAIVANDAATYKYPVSVAGSGSVSVTSSPIDGSINGPAEPTIDSYTHAAISASAATANQELIAAPGASKQIWVYGINFTADTGDGSASFQDEDDTAITGVMPFAENGGMAVAPSGNFAMPMWKVATNKALEVDTLVCGIKGSIQYGIVSV